MNGLSIYGQHDEQTIKQAQAVFDSGADRVIVCADGHLGYGHPIGGVAAYRDHISLSGVGYDIACGCYGVETTQLVDGFDVVGAISWIWNNISFGIGRTNDLDATQSPEYLDCFGDPLWDADPLALVLKSMAQAQFGTIGSGNHYVDLLRDTSTNRLWLACHFGSRGFGHKVTTHFLNAVGAVDDMMAPPALLVADSESGQRYLRLMTLAGRYAYAAREWVLARIAQQFDLDVTFQVHNHHNFCWEETHDGTMYYVVRKGATPAFPGQYGFIGGSMGHDAVVVRGVDSERSKLDLYSTVHGAGRTMSRTAAKGKWKKGVQVKEGALTQQAMNHIVEQRGVILRGADLDESPEAYRDLSSVLTYHAGTIEITHILRPVGVAMAGPGIHDPYKD